ncbi:MAG: hypothetical protein WA085_12685 [Sphingobium sp.]
MAVTLQRGSLSTSQMFLHTAGNAWACGANASGQLGLGDTAQRNLPVALAKADWVQLACGPSMTAGVDSSGRLYTCGNMSYLGHSAGADQTTFLQVGTDTDWASVAYGSVAGYAIKTSGVVWAWGTNSFGQLGRGNYTSSVTPVAIAFSAAAIAAGSGFCIAITPTGTMFGVGLGTGGQLGVGDAATKTVFTQIGSASNWVKIAAGESSCVAVNSAGELWGWGVNDFGQLGLGDLTQRDSPTRIGLATDWVDVACGYGHMHAINTAGEVWGCGSNWEGSLGLGDTTDRSTLTRVGAAVWDAVYATGANVFVTGGGALWVSGRGSDGTHGLNDTVQRTSLTQNTFLFAGVILESMLEYVAIVSALEGGGPRTLEVTDAADIASAIHGNLLLSDALAESANTTEALTMLFASMIRETSAVSSAHAIGSITSTAVVDAAAVLDVIQQSINQIIADSADGTDTFSIGAALALVDIADAAATQTSTYNSVMMVAELVAAIEAYNGADAYDITESSALSDTYVARVSALVAMLEAAQAVDTNTALVHVMQYSADSADGATTITSAGSLINALLADSMLATIRLNVGGELFTGWVLNADTLAPSEYQFADLQFNSACRHGDTYLLAADDGIYQFTEETNVETVMTYIKTGKTDFGSDMRKGITNAYMVYSAAGQMTLKVTTSANGVLQTNDYAMVPFSSTETPDPQRVTVGKGLKSRYWQFELTGANAGCTFDEIGMLPVVLSRRI